MTTRKRLFVAALLCALSACSAARRDSVRAMNEGIQLAQAGRNHDAVDALERAMSIDPTNDQAAYNAALLHIKMQEYGLAKRALEDAIQANPERGGYYQRLGEVSVMLEDWGAAREAYQQAIEIEPDLFRPYYELGKVAEAMGEPQTALQRYNEAIEKNPRFVDAYSALGYLYSEYEFEPQAIQVLQAGLQVCLEDTGEEAELHALLGQVHLDQDSYEQAIASFRESLSIAPGRPSALFGLGEAYFLNDDGEEAARFFQRFVDVAGEEHASRVGYAQRRIGELAVH